ncbi:hypothetical protein [uncultured Deinococcus sp.]|uniref:hypothetical protein n=1 Tax=uncultured Deinococcus sp. TaxID=158789 RepID=UPI00258E13B4|nr:hypothetical protein [uncultured Deinococcus sp.]
MTDPKQTGLPEDAGNGMSDRSGYADESETGMTDTPLGDAAAPAPDAVPAPAGQTDSDHSTGTSFGTVPQDDKGQ